MISFSSDEEICKNRFFLNCSAELTKQKYEVNLVHEKGLFEQIFCDYCYF
jgi:hypothetical protein